ncbi:unnamed protein product, partial [Oppiella nova]
IEFNLSDDQKRKCEQFVNIFKFNSTQFNYGFCDHFNDGNGLTAGRSLFTTKSGDVYHVVRKYSFRRPFNLLVPFQDQLKRLADNKSSDVLNLKGFPMAWKSSASDPVFRIIQDRVNDELYYRPAMRLAFTLNLRSALSKCIIYDTISQHGVYKTVNTFKTIIPRNESKEKDKMILQTEKIWIRHFLKLRQILLEDYEHRVHTNEWLHDMDSVDGLLDLISEGNWHFKEPIRVGPQHH